MQQPPRTQSNHNHNHKWQVGAFVLAHARTVCRVRVPKVHARWRLPRTGGAGARRPRQIRSLCGEDDSGV